MAKKHKPEVRLVQSIHPNVVTQLRAIGMYRCQVLVPSCSGEPVAEVMGKDGVRHLFCRMHTTLNCAALGLSVPAYPQDSN